MPPSESQRAPSHDRLGLLHAAALGLLQGPTELLPVSSSAHTTLIPWLAGWPYGELEPELRKSFEIALHAGAAGALALEMRGELLLAARSMNRRRLAVILLSLAPPALAGFAFEGPIERRLGGPRSIAAGLLAGALAMALADAPGRAGARHEDEAKPRDGLALGLAQAAALVPGVSRNGATLAAARARGFARADAQRLSWHAGLPVMLGAVAHRARGLSARGVPRSVRLTLAVGAVGAFASTRASAGLRGYVGEHSLLPYSLYRGALAATTLHRLRRAQNGNR